MATPLPLAFLALGVASGTFSGVELHWVPSSQAWVAGLVAVSLTAPLQALSAVFAFIRMDPVAGTGTGIIAGTWAVSGIVTLLEPPGGRSQGLGLFLVVAATALVVPVAAGTPTPLATVVVAFSQLRFAVTGVSELAAASAWQTLAGALGVGLALVALYAALAFELEGAHGRPILPTGPHRSGASP